MDLSDPVAATLLCAEALDRAGIPHAVHGALLLGAYGEPRETHDADFAIAQDDLGAVERALRHAGLDIRSAFAGLVLGGHTLDRFTLLPGEGDTGLNCVDFIRPRSPGYRARALGRALLGPLDGHQIRVLAPEDYLLFKLLSTRERDARDAASVLRRMGGLLDIALVRREVDALAAEIPDFDIRATLKTLVRLREDPQERRQADGLPGEVHEMPPARWKRLKAAAQPPKRRRK